MYGMNNMTGPYDDGAYRLFSGWNSSLTAEILVTSGVLPGMMAAQQQLQSGCPTKESAGANSTTPNNITNGVSPNGGAQVPGKSGTNPGTPTAMSSVSAHSKSWAELRAVYGERELQVLMEAVC